MENPTRRLAFYDLRDWWMSHPRAQHLLDSNDSRPFFPVAQQPETAFPWVRYTVSREPNAPTWWRYTERVGIEIFTGDIEDSTELLNIFMSMAGRHEKSAWDLERWMRENNRQIDFAFHEIEYVGGGDIGAPSEQGAAHSRIAMFSIHYSPLVADGISS